MKTKTDRRDGVIGGERADERKRGRTRESKGARWSERGTTKRTRERRVTRRRAVEGLRQKAPARFHGHPVYTPPLPCNAGQGEREEARSICPIPTHSRSPFSHSISFCHCSFFRALVGTLRERERERERFSAGLPRNAPFFSHHLSSLCRFCLVPRLQFRV